MTCDHPAEKIRSIDGGNLRCDQCRTILPKLTPQQALAQARAAIADAKESTK